MTYVEQIPSEERKESFDDYKLPSEQVKILPIPNSLYIVNESDSDLLSHIKKLRELGRVFETGSLINKLSAKTQRTEYVTRCLEYNALVMKQMMEVENIKGWTLQVDGNNKGAEGISIHYRNTVGSPIVEVRGTSQINCSVSNIWTIAREVDLWSIMIGKFLPKVETKLC